MTITNSGLLNSPEQATPATADATVPGTRVVWDESKMFETYANVATVLATQEEFSLLFGIQRGLRPDPRGMNVQLASRVMVNPFLAKRLLGVLTRTIEEYERRFGEIKES
jgi:hypothetical protein